MPRVPTRATRRFRANTQSLSGVDSDNSLLTEHQVQREFVKWFRQTLKGIRIFAIPNGGYRSRATAMQLKVEGVSKGVPDLFCPELYLFIEMKREKGGIVSEQQKDWIDYLNSIGYTAIVCRGLDDAKMQVIEYMQTAQKFRNDQ